jgi:hypothetical protein
MIYKGVAKGKVIQLEGDAALPEGTRVSVIPEQPAIAPQQSLRAWLQEARQLRARLPMTSDSVEILQQLRGRRVSQ